MVQTNMLRIPGLGNRNDGVLRTGETVRRNAASHGKPVHYIHHPSFSTPSTEEELWGTGRTDVNVAAYTLKPEVVEDGDVSPAKRTSLSPREERLLFLQYNFAKYQWNRLSDDPDDLAGVELANLWKRRALEIREKIIHANLPLVTAIARKKPISGVLFSDVISEGYLAILQCVEHFDVSKGFKFSTYAFRAVLSCLSRMGIKAQTHKKRFPVPFDSVLERDDADERRQAKQREDVVESVRAVLRRNIAGLSRMQKDVICKRYFLDKNASPQPFWKVGQLLGVSTERARQIEKVSLKKLQQALCHEKIS